MSGGPQRRSPAWLAGPILLAVVVVLAGLAAIGARDLPGSGTSRSIAARVGWDPLTVLTWLALGFFVFLAYTILSTPRSRMVRRGGGRRRSRPMAIAVALAVLAVVLLFTDPGERGRPPGFEPGLPGEGSLAEAPPEQLTGSAVGLLIFVGVLTVAGVTLFYLLRREPIEPSWETVSPDLVASLTAAIDELDMGGDPRRTIIAAYTNMEASFSRAGLPRLRHEAPLEYVGRVLGRLAIDDDLITRLAALFQEARFSTHVIDERMAADASEILVRIRASLEPV